VIFIGAKMDGPERYRGSLLGLAVGDAVGTTLEFLSSGTFEPIREYACGAKNRTRLPEVFIVSAEQKHQEISN
jgi:ADP-ribosylglycohydrolase